VLLGSCGGDHPWHLRELKGFGNAFILVDDDVTLISAGLARRCDALTACEIAG
jgi:hypothetical protein